MPLSAGQCKQFDSFLFRRTPDWDKKLTKDRYPYANTYNGIYKSAPWESGTGVEHTYDRVHVTRIQDNGCWDSVNIDPCVGSPCDPDRSFVGWGSTRKTYGKYRRDYQTPPFCFDQLRDTEMAVDQLSQIVSGLKKIPDQVISDYLRMWALRSCETVYICGADAKTVEVTDDIFSNNCTSIDLGSDSFLPTSKLTMSYLDNFVENLQYNGYFENEFVPTGKFMLMSDIQTNRSLSNNNPALSVMYNAADFVKGGKFYAYGVMSGVGNWLLKVDSEPLRFNRSADGVLTRVFPYENIDTTGSGSVGKKPVFSTAYKNAKYQMYHVYNPAARTVYTPYAEPVNGDMKFDTSRVFNGRWSWKNPDVIIYTDPNTGQECTLRNDKHNQGYFLGEFEIGVKTEYPEIEMCILAEREPQVIVNDPRVASWSDPGAQDLIAYNSLCGDP